MHQNKNNPHILQEISTNILTKMSDITGSPTWACSEKCKQKKFVTENSVSTVCNVEYISVLMNKNHFRLLHWHSHRRCTILVSMLWTELFVAVVIIVYCALVLCINVLINIITANCQKKWKHFGRLTLYLHKLIVTNTNLQIAIWLFKKKTSIPPKQGQPF